MRLNFGSWLTLSYGDQNSSKYFEYYTTYIRVIFAANEGNFA